MPGNASAALILNRPNSDAKALRDGPLFFYWGGGVTFFVKKNCSQAVVG